MNRWLLDRLTPARFRQEVAVKATALILVHDALAYAVAREQGRQARLRATEIAKREGWSEEIGADRWGERP